MSKSKVYEKEKQITKYLVLLFTVTSVMLSTIPPEMTII